MKYPVVGIFGLLSSRNHHFVKYILCEKIYVIETMEPKISLIIIIILVFSLPLCTSCEYPEVEGEQSNPAFEGIWVEPEYGDSGTILIRALELKENSYGLNILPDNSVVERAIAGPCATPPVIYADRTGSWFLADSLLTLQVPFWGGQLKTTWRILEITPNHLRMKLLDQADNP